MNPRTNTPSQDARFWNKIAVKYSKQPVQDPNAFERKIAVTRGLMTERDRVLDIGCGTGSLAIRLAPFAHQVHGLDFSPEMIRIAREKAVTLGVPNVSFEVGSLDQSVPFEPGSLDGVTAYSLLHLVKDRSKTLQHIHHLLRPGGFFVSSTVCLAGSWVPYGCLLMAMRLFRQAPETVELFSARTLIDEIESAGFVDVSSPDVGARPEIAFIVARKAPG
jgi:arsenite methyltransferase